MSVAPLGKECIEYRAASADRRLHELSLTRAQLEGAIQFGDERRQLVSPLCPKTYPGQVMWAETVRALRERLIGSGHDWRPESGRNYETVDSDATGVSIAYVGGDQRTGRPGLPYPTTARARGPMTRERVDQNNRMVLVLPGMELAQDGTADEPPATWFLMAHGSGKAIQAELSLPLIIGNDGYVKVWAERILLDDIDTASGVTPIEVEPVTTPAVHVRRRG